MLLLVDAQEGPKPQTRFVLKKAPGCAPNPNPNPNPHPHPHPHPHPNPISTRNQARFRTADQFMRQLMATAALAPRVLKQARPAPY